MSYRRAFFTLLGIILVASAAAFFIVRDQIEAPDWVVAIAAVVAVGGAILTFLPNVHDSTEFVQGMLTRVAGKKESAPTLVHDIDSPSQSRNRENLLNNMHQTWVEGALHHSLHNMILIELGMTYDRKAVSRPTQPWQMTLRQDDTDVVIPHHKTMADIFAENGRSLLILGAPGSGKTITLLQLAQALIADAQADATRPMPVVLNLSSWNQQKGTIGDWVAEEMFVQYQTPRGLTANWLQHNQLLLLLDGLDEAAPEAQEACITAINQFKEGNAAEIVVCSRQEDYAKLRNRLNLTIAVRLQPLALMQMHNYLNRFGERVHGFRDALRFDTELQKLASSPLALSLVPLVYGGRTAAEIPRSTSVEAGRRTLFQNYVQQMFRRRPLPAGTKYVPAQAMQWLSQMGNHMGNETDFYIERLQPTWLTPQNQQRYKWLTKLLGGLTVGLSFGLVVGLNIGLMGWLIGGLALALVVVVAQDGEIELAENLVWQRPTLKDFFQNFMTSFLSVSLAPISLGIVDKLDLGLWGFLIVPVVLPLITAGLLLPLYRLFGLETERLIIGLILVTVLGLTTGLIWGLIWGIRIELITGIIWGLIIGLIWGLIEGLIMEAFQGQETVKRSTPNQSIRQSGNNVIGFLLAGLLGGVVYALVLWWLDGQLWGLANIGYFRLGGGLQGALLSGISMGVLLGFAVSIQFGAQLILCHYILRGLLHREGVLPAFPRTRTLIDFLDAMSDRILLQRLSGGWRFVHRYLKEYITSLSPDEIDALFDE